MDQEGKLIPKERDEHFNQSITLSNEKHIQEQQEGVQKIISKIKPSEQKQKATQDQQKQKQQVDDGLIDVIKELTQNKNPLPIIAVIDQIDLYTKTNDGVPLFNLLMNKFLPIEDLLDKLSIKFLPDQDGRTPLHYAVQVDDVKAVNWLLKKGAQNTSDKFGNTPVMDAIRLGHRRSFLLLLHYQHLNEELPHIGAQYNRVWQLKCLLSKGLSLELRDNQSKTPLQIAVMNYSYQAAQYLASVTKNYQIDQLKKLTDSKGIIRKVQNGKSKSSKIDRILAPLIYRLLPLFIILIAGRNIQFYQSIMGTINWNILIFFILYAFAFIISKIPKKQKPNENILHLLFHPMFPNNTDHICPSCMNRYNHEKEDHCDACHTCVNKFQLHSQFCINSLNQSLWYAYQFWLLYLLWGMVNRVVDYQRITYVHQQGQQQSYIWIYLTVFHDLIYKINIFATTFMVFLIGYTLQQTAKCLQLFGMAFMNRTYQQTIRSQDYPHLYTVFRSKAGKLKTKQDRLFYKYKLMGGLCVGIKNIVTYFL